MEVPYIIPDYFIGYGFGVEELSINNANLLIVHANAFVHIRGIKKLDLSNNQIRDIHENAFAEVRCKLMINIGLRISIHSVTIKKIIKVHIIEFHISY